MINLNSKSISAIGERIKALRISKKLTQAELAQALNVKRQTVAQWENQERDLKTGAIISSEYQNIKHRKLQMSDILPVFLQCQ